jgi:hypothetical protein
MGYLRTSANQAAELSNLAFNPIWQTIRAAANAGFTSLALGFAKAMNADCDNRSGFMWECHMDHPGGQVLTFGNVMFNKDSRPMSTDLLSHETKHADQYALMGAFFIPAYFADMGLAKWTSGDYGCGIFDYWAGYLNGGYDQCVKNGPYGPTSTTLG